MEDEIAQRIKKLQDSEASCRAVFETVVDSIVTIDEMGIILAVNPATERMFSYSAAELVGQNVAMLMPSPDRERHDLYLEDYRRTGLSRKVFDQGHEAYAQRKNGTIFPVWLAVSETQIAGQRVFIGQIHDITERKRAEEALREAEAFSVIVRNSLIEHLAVLDEQGVILIVNQAWQRFAEENGSPELAAHSVGMNYLAVCEKAHLYPHGEEGAAARDGILAVMNGLQPEFTLEYPCSAPGQERWFQMHVGPLHDGRKGVVIAHLDVTKRKLAEDRILRLSQLYEALSKCNQAIVHSASEKELLPTICRNVVEVGRLKMAWYGVIDETRNIVRPETCFGSGTEYLKGIEIPLDINEPAGRGPVGVAIRENNPSWFQDFQNDPRAAFWRDRAARFGWRAVASLPIRRSGKPIGALTVYSDVAGAFDKEVCSLLEEMAHDISFALDNIVREKERKEALEAVIRSERKYHELVESANSIILRWSADGSITFLNEFGLKFFGYAKSEIIGRPVIETIVPETEESGRNLAHLMDEIRGNPEAFEHNINENKCKDGRHVWIAWTNKIVLDERGRFKEILSVGTDITERHIAEARVARLTQLYAALSQCNQSIVRCTTVDELLPRICRDIVEFGGMKMAWIGMLDKSSGMIHPVASFGSGTDYLDGIEISVDVEKPTGRGPSGAAIRENKPVWCQDFQNDPSTALWHERSAPYGWASIASLPLCKHGKPIGCLVIYSGKPLAFDEEMRKLLTEMASDISFAFDNFARDASRKEAEQQLRLRESFLSGITENQPGLLWLKDTAGRFLMVNKAFANACGRENPEDVHGLTDLDIWPKNLAEKYQNDDRHVMRTGSPIMVEEEIFTGGGNVWHETFKTPVRDVDGYIIGTTGYARDITDRKHAEEAILKAKTEAETANKAKDQFIAVLSHELRTPLTPIFLSSGAMDAEPDIPESIRSDLKIIRRNVELEMKLVDDLLDVTRVSRGMIQLHQEIVDAHHCLQNALGICQSEIDAKHLNVSLRLDADLSHVWADPVRLQQVFWNLLRNAVKFTPEGGQIGIQSANIDSRLHIEFSDTGIGIDPAVFPKLFKAFEQGEQSKTRRFGGLGLGLNIAKAVMDLHHGTLTAFSKGIGKGATFTVEIDTVPTAKETPAVAAPPVYEAGSRKILLVEDNADTLRILAKMLQKWGYTVKTADSVQSAMKAAGEEIFDLLVSDIGLPDGSGLKIMQEMKKRRAVNGIAISGFGTEEDIRESREAGFAEHLVKPVSFQLLRETVQRVATEQT